MKLTPRELDVLQLTANGVHNRQIAKMLNIKESTVKGYKKHINEKLGTVSGAHSVAEGIRRGLI